MWEQPKSLTAHPRHILLDCILLNCILLNSHPPLIIRDDTMNLKDIAPDEESQA